MDGGRGRGTTGQQEAGARRLGPGALEQGQWQKGSHAAMLKEERREATGDLHSVLARGSWAFDTSNTQEFPCMRLPILTSLNLKNQQASGLRPFPGEITLQEPCPGAPTPHRPTTCPCFSHGQQESAALRTTDQPFIS